MSAKRIKDDRLHSRPRVYRNEDGAITMKFRAMTPFRILMLQHFLLHPATGVWRFLALLCALDYGLSHFEILPNLFPVFQHLPFTRSAFVVAMLIPVALWCVERFGKNPISRLLLGKTIRIKITDDEVTVRSSLLSGETYPRNRRLGFAMYPFQNPRTSVYRNAELFCVILDDINRQPLAEIANRTFLSRVVTNANVALMLPAQQAAGSGPGIETDPVKERLRRLRGKT